MPPINRKPAELFAPAGLDLVLAANRASHTRRRAVRVMVVVMVQGQHETFKVSDGGQPVNSENSMLLIGIADSRCRAAAGPALLLFLYIPLEPSLPSMANCT